MLATTALPKMAFRRKHSTYSCPALLGLGQGVSRNLLERGGEDIGLLRKSGFLVEGGKK